MLHVFIDESLQLVCSCTASPPLNTTSITKLVTHLVSLCLSRFHKAEIFDFIVAIHKDILNTILDVHSNI